MEKKFADVAMRENHPKWERAIERGQELYHREKDIRSPFARDYTRILHAMSYRRLKHKTQVFFNTRNDHICTRMEHVLHVESVSTNISDALGLNSELVKAIAMGHDLGHAPFGHAGENVLSGLTKKYLQKDFWHEGNGVRVVDKLDLINTPRNVYQNLDLTYAVRDGIISHCGEVDENALYPRKEKIDLYGIKRAGQYNAYTWEGCVVKLSDKIAYLGRDIEDALKLHIIRQEDLIPLMKIASSHGQENINTSVIMHEFIVDLVEHSSPEKGICLSQEKVKLMDEIKRFNTERIYHHKKLEPFVKYSELILETIFDFLKQFYNHQNTLTDLKEKEWEPVTGDFYRWMLKYCEKSILPKEDWKICERYENEKIYGTLDTEQVYYQAVFDYIAGMTDAFAMDAFHQIISF